MLSRLLRFALVLCAFFAAFLVTASSPRNNVTIAVWGDSRENLDNACEEIASILLNDVTGWDVQIHTGDFTHDGSAASWDRSMQYKGMKNLFVQGKMLLCTSNHDAQEKSGAAGDKRSNWDRWTAGVLPVNDVDSTTHFYAWQKGNVHVIALDGYLTDPVRMQTWLDNYLSHVAPDDWIVAAWHNPAYALTYKEPYLPTCGPWLESLSRHCGVFVVNGHAHLYLRTKPMLPDGTVDDAHGIVHIINGTGGASWKDPAEQGSQVAFTPATRSFPCITFLTFERNVATVRTVDARPGKNLNVIDEWRWEKPGAGQ